MSACYCLDVKSEVLYFNVGFYVWYLKINAYFERKVEYLKTHDIHTVPSNNSPHFSLYSDMYTKENKGGGAKKSDRCYKGNWYTNKIKKASHCFQ